MPDDKILTAQEAADYLHVDLHQLFHLTVTDAIPSKTVDERVFYLRSDLDRWRNSQ